MAPIHDGEDGDENPSTFNHLPLEIYTCIAEHLVAGTRYPFPPRYSGTDDVDLDKKRDLFYGTTTTTAAAAAATSSRRGEDIDDDNGGMGLLYWSSTSSQFRALLAPLVFRQVVVRSRAKSVRSIAAVAGGEWWRCVRTLVVVGTWEQWGEMEQEKVDGEGEEVVDESEAEARITAVQEKELKDLEEILLNLPPNLSGLVLDFPNTYTFEYDWDYYVSEGVSEHRFLWEDRMEMCLNAITRYQPSDPRDFSLCLYNVTPIKVSTYEDPEFHRFLGRVSCLKLGLATSVGLAVCELSLSSGAQANDFACCLGEWFFDHVTQATSISVHADAAWTLGRARGMWNLRELRSNTQT